MSDGTQLMGSMGDRAPATPKTPTSTDETTATASSEEGKPAEGSQDLGSDVFTDLANEDLHGEVEALEGDETPPATPPKKAETPPTEPVKTPAQQAAEAVKATEAVVEGTKPAEGVKPAEGTKPAETKPAVEAPPQKTAEEVKAAQEKARKDYFDKITAEYSLSEEDANAVVTDPEKVLPRVLAKVHMDVMDRMTAWVQTSLPYMLQSHSQQEAARQAHTKAFFDAWPELNKQEYGATVARTLTAYRQANPDAKAEDVIREGGVMALINLRLPMPERIMKSHNVNEAEPAKPAGFTPAPTGSGAALPPKKPSDNAFTVLAEEDIVDDRG